MNRKALKNVTASIRQRLLNKSRSEGRPFQELLQYYAMERFLYRLSQSAHADKFILKGALMLRVWRTSEIRPTMDIDLLGRTDNEEENILMQIREIISVEVEPDGMIYDIASIQAMRITEDADYEGIRIRFYGALDSARVNMQIDVGFGDMIYPEPEEIELPTVLDSPAPALLGYSRESVIAEKFEAMLTLGSLNSRMKDFYDIWFLCQCFDFEGDKLAEAMKRTLEKRGVVISGDVLAFSGDFARDKVHQWTAFRKKLNQDSVPVDFEEVSMVIKGFLSPIAETLASGSNSPKKWFASGSWTWE